MAKPARDVNAYIAAAPPDVRGRLKQLRQAIRAAAPDAVERIGYGMPYYEQNGIVVSFAWYKSHIGLYPIRRELAKELEKYAAHKATARFPLDRPLPIALIKRLVRARVKNNNARKKQKPAR